MNSKKMVKINIGSGPTGESDWINLDWGILAFLGKIGWLTKIFIGIGLLPKKYSSNWPKSLYLVDCRKRLPFKDNSVDYVYSSHFIEHLYYYQVLDLIKECQRVLRPGGVLRISIPDIKLLSEKYINGDKDFFLNLEDNMSDYSHFENIADLFIQHIYGYNLWAKPSFLEIIQRQFIRGHLWMYDFNSLSFIFKESGFVDIRRCQPSEGDTPGIDRLDIHRLSSLFIEATKC